MERRDDFDFAAFEAEALEKLRLGKPLEGSDGVLGPLLKRLLEASLEGEMDAHLSEEKASGRANRRNGRVRKTVKSSLGPLELEQSRDRLGSFQPALVGKRERTLGNTLEQKVLSFYASGMSYSAIQSHLRELYGLEVSAGKLSAITDRVWPEVEAWRARPLEACYPIVWMDAMYVKLRTPSGRVESRCLYSVLGLDVEGHKSLLGMYLGHDTGEGARFWLQVLTDLQQRGVEEILIACIDHLKGFSEAIASIYPHTRVQLCIVHQVRNSMRYVGAKDAKAFMADLKGVYQAPNREAGRAKLDLMEATWGQRYGVVIESWRRNWELLSEFFDYAQEIRRIIYTTNTIEGYHRQLRKITKTKGSFTSEKSLLKLVYLAQLNIARKWSGPVHNWGMAISQMSILFGDRIKRYLHV